MRGIYKKNVKLHIYLITILILSYYSLAIVYSPSLLYKGFFSILFVLVAIQTYRLHNIELSINGWIYGEVEPTNMVYISLLALPLLINFLFEYRMYILIWIPFLFIYTLYRLVKSHNTYVNPNPPEKIRSILRKKDHDDDFEVRIRKRKIIIKYEMGSKRLKKLIRSLEAV